MNAALWAIAVSVILLGIAVALVGLVLTQIAKSAQALTEEYMERNNNLSWELGELQSKTQAHIDSPRHNNTPKRKRKKAEQPTLEQNS